MDGAQACYLYPTVAASARPRRVGGRGGLASRLRRASVGPGIPVEVLKRQAVRPRGTAPSADLGGSSKYSNENFEGRSGERFHVNSSWT